MEEYQPEWSRREADRQEDDGFGESGWYVIQTRSRHENRTFICPK
jgi:hypothetical protein